MQVRTTHEEDCRNDRPFQLAGSGAGCVDAVPFDRPAVVVATAYIQFKAAQGVLRIVAEHNWPKPTRAQRRRFPEKREMDDLHDRMDALHEENRVLFASLPAIIATSSLGICGKLAIAHIEVARRRMRKRTV